MANKQKITPYFWFDTQAEEAANFYTSIFPNSKTGRIQHQGEAVLTIDFSLSGQKFIALNGGPMFTINPSVSFYTVCESETELDHAWEKLMEGGKAMMPLDKYPWSEKYGWVTGPIWCFLAIDPGQNF